MEPAQASGSPLQAVWRTARTDENLSPRTIPKDLTGYSVAISGNAAVVGAPGTKNNAGAAKIYVRSGTAWHHSATLNDPRGASGDEFGWSVAVSSTLAGTFVVIGGSDTNGKPDIVYVYKHSGRAWRLQSKIPDPGSSSQDMFGDSVAISATTLVIAASCLSNFSGEVYIYQRSGSSWHLQASFADPASQSGDSFGGSLAVSGKTVLVGARDVAYVYSLNAGNGWNQTARLKNPGGTNDLFGYSVALSGTTAVIGTPGNALTQAGRAYVYVKSGGRWRQQARLTDPPSPNAAQFGYSVAIVGKRVLIGVPVHGRVNCGTAYEYIRSGSRWRERQAEVSSECTPGDRYGAAVAMSGRTAFIGAPDKNEQTGAVYVVTLP
jgi:hypothetical protein